MSGSPRGVGMIFVCRPWLCSFPGSVRLLSVDSARLGAAAEPPPLRSEVRCRTRPWRSTGRSEWAVTHCSSRSQFLRLNSDEGRPNYPMIKASTGIVLAPSYGITYRKIVSAALRRTARSCQTCAPPPRPACAAAPLALQRPLGDTISPTLRSGRAAHRFPCSTAHWRPSA